MSLKRTEQNPADAALQLHAAKVRKLWRGWRFRNRGRLEPGPMWPFKIEDHVFTFDPDTKNVTCDGVVVENKDGMTG